MHLTVRDHVLLFLADRCDRSSSKTIESTGLTELAVTKGLVPTSNAFGLHLVRLKKDKMIDSTRAGKQVSLYCLTPLGDMHVADLRKHLDNQKSENKQGDKMMPSPSIEDQLRAKMNIPSPSYSTPVGVALPKQGKYTEDVAGILDLYKDRIDPRPNDNDKQRLREEFDKLSAEGRPAFHWIQEAICRTSAKVRAEQRNIAYMLGILKNWRAYGYGTDYSAEHKKMFTIFERRFDCFMTDTSRQKLLELIDNHGVVDAMDALYNTTEEDIDPSLRLVMQMEVFLSRSEA